MNKIKLLVIGAGGHGRSVAEAALLSGEYQLAGFLDDAIPVGEMVMGLPVMGSIANIEQIIDECDLAIVAIGNNVVRAQLMQQLYQIGIGAANVIHPHAFVSPTATLGSGIAIMAAAVVGTEARLGDGVIVNCAAVVDHHADVEDFGHLGVNACMAGGSQLGKGAWMQAGSSLGYGVSIPPGEILEPGVAVKKHDQHLKKMKNPLTARPGGF